MIYSKSLGITIPQTTVNPFSPQPQIKNNAGGFVFGISNKEALDRFLFIGTENNTYYVSAAELTINSCTKIKDLIKEDPQYVFNRTMEVLNSRTSFKRDPAIFVLALLSDSRVKQQVYNMIPTVLKTGTDLLMFVANVNLIRGWSSGLRKAIARWYTTKSPDVLAYQILKYQNRCGFSHKDVLRLSHPKVKDGHMNNIFKYIVEKLPGEESGNKLIEATTLAHQTESTEVILKLLKEGMSWEMLPTEKLNNQEILKALMYNMPSTALIRNLNRFAYTGLTSINNNFVKDIISKLKETAGLHPVNILNYMITYNKGTGLRGSKTWTPNQDIVGALHDLYESSIKTSEIKERTLIGVDVSGSMNHEVAGQVLNAAELSNVLAYTYKKISPTMVDLVGFDTKIRDLPYSIKDSVFEVVKKSPRGGGTDCSLPIKYALNNNIKYDKIIILTDSETWAGKEHSFELLNQYRKTNPDVKIIEVAMVANGLASFPDDEKLLRVVGFDSGVLNLINNF